MDWKAPFLYYFTENSPKSHNHNYYHLQVLGTFAVHIFSSPPPQRQAEGAGLEKRKLQGDFITAFQYLKGVYKEEESQLFTRVDIGRTKGNGF